MWSKIVAALNNWEDPDERALLESSEPICRACGHEYQKPYVDPWRGLTNRVRAWQGQPAQPFRPMCSVSNEAMEGCFCEHPFHAPRG
jgi:hypothetical protein